jgi:hypothetical protein
MKISIAMCTFNGGPFIKEQLESIAKQTRLPDELLVSDDGSSDETLRILQEFASSSPFPVRVSVNERTLGTTKNSEKVLSACSGDIIALCDQDDVWHSDKLELIEREFISAPGIGLVFSEAEMVDAELRPQRWNLFRTVGFDRKEQKLVTEGKALNVLMARTVVGGATMAFRSRFRELIFPIPSEGPLIQDGWIVLMIAAVAAVAFIDKPLIKYRQHPAQQMGARKTSTIQGIIQAQKTAPNSYLAQAAQFQQARDRLAANNGHSANERVLSLFRDKISHLQARATMPTQRFRRVPVVLKEISNLHYHRFSRGWLSAAKDLLT